MIPNTGSWAKYTFINKFQPLNNIYQITSVENFESAINRGVDFYKNLYTPTGLSEDDWKIDYPKYSGNDVYWLKSSDNNSSEIPVPTGILAKYPDLDVDVYYPLILRITVGLYKSPDELQYLADDIKDMVSATTGETSSVVWSTTSAGKVYKTKSDYNKLDQQRKNKATQLTPLITQVTQKDKVIDDLKSRVDYLEKALIQAINK